MAREVRAKRKSEVGVRVRCLRAIAVGGVAILALRQGIRRRRGSSCALLVGAGLLVVPAAAAAQSLAPSLMGEQFQDSVFDPDSTVEVNCNPDGTSTIHYRLVDGVAAGPYPGTFDEQGTITIGPQTNASVPPGIGINDFPTGDAEVHATFTIDSSVGQVSGQKSTTATFEGQGVCREFSGESEGRPFSGREVAVFSALEYEARITTATGTFRDTGTSTIYLTKGENVGTPPFLLDAGLFIEQFLSSEGVVAVLPTSKEQCQDEGFGQFVGFKNQGDCVAFVETGGKNEPGRNVPGVP